jgi:hypothetical protein
MDNLSPPNFEAPVVAPAVVEQPVVEAPAVEPVVEPVVVGPEETSPPMRAESNGDYTYGFEDSTPCHWDIKPLENGGPDEIEAYNSQTQERFVGLMVDFNAALRA